MEAEEGAENKNDSGQRCEPQQITGRVQQGSGDSRCANERSGSDRFERKIPVRKRRLVNGK